MYSWINSGVNNTQQEKITDVPFYLPFNKKLQILEKEIRKNPNFQLRQKTVSLSDSYSEAWNLI